VFLNEILMIFMNFFIESDVLIGFLSDNTFLEKYSPQKICLKYHQ
jgi:hypothetical protein